MIIYSPRVSFPELLKRNHPATNFVDQVYKAFSSLDLSKVDGEHILASTNYRTKDGQSLLLTVKINHIGYLVAQLTNKSEMGEPLQEMIVKASPEFQNRRADDELKRRIKDAISDSIECVIDGISPSLRKALALKFAGDRNVTLINGFDDRRLAGAGVLNTFGIGELIESPGEVDQFLRRESVKRPLIVALGAMTIFIFSL